MMRLVVLLALAAQCMAAGHRHREARFGPCCPRTPPAVLPYQMFAQDVIINSDLWDEEVSRGVFVLSHF